MDSRKTWALVSTGARARILCGLDRAAPREISLRARPEHLREAISDRAIAGSALKKTRPQGPAPEARRDPVQQDMQAFARDIWALLERHKRQGEFERLVMIASPGMLRTLQDEIPEALQDTPTLARAAHWVPLSEADLRQRVAQMLAEGDGAP